MTRRALLALLSLLPGLNAQDASAIVGAARDLLCQALELLSARSTPDQVIRAVDFLKLALDQYPSYGDAHYYRYLCLKRLGADVPMQKRSLEYAAQYQSEALQQKLNPFILAVPKLYEDRGAVDQKWAIVIGVGEFKVDDPDKLRPLPSAANDAKAFYALLCDPEVGKFPAAQVSLLLNEHATTSAIKAALNKLARKAKPEDLVVVYVATHGSSRDQDTRQVNYLITYDTDPTEQDLIFATALPMIEVSGIISSRCFAQRTLLIFDTCHSGSSFPGENLSLDDINRLREGAGRYILCSCEANQSSYEKASGGYFTSALVEKLREYRGCIRLNDLFTQVQAEVSSRVMNEQRRQQRPVMYKSDNAAEIVLGVSPGSSNEQCLASHT